MGNLSKGWQGCGPNTPLVKLHHDQYDRKAKSLRHPDAYNSSHEYDARIVESHTRWVDTHAHTHAPKSCAKHLRPLVAGRSTSLTHHAASHTLRTLAMRASDQHQSSHGATLE